VQKRALASICAILSKIRKGSRGSACQNRQKASFCEHFDGFAKNRQKASFSEHFGGFSAKIVEK